MSRQRPCPIRDNPANESGEIDAKIGENGEPVFQFRYTPEGGSGEPQASCAFLELSKQALAHQNIDSTQLCRRCTRVVRVRSLKTPLFTPQHQKDDTVH
jgi:hypothetical protein